LAIVVVGVVSFVTLPPSNHGHSTSVKILGVAEVTASGSLGLIALGIVLIVIGPLLWNKVPSDTPQTASDGRSPATPSTGPPLTVPSPAQSQPAPLAGGPIAWDGRPLIYNMTRQSNGHFSGATPVAIGLLSLRGSVTGRDSVQFKAAYISSGLTGEKRPFRINTRAGYLDADIFSIDEINPA
jgi:hypothetical protein